MGKHVSLIISAPAGTDDSDFSVSVSVTASGLRGEFAWKTFLVVNWFDWFVKVVAGVEKKYKCMECLPQQHD